MKLLNKHFMPICLSTALFSSPAFSQQGGTNLWDEASATVTNLGSHVVSTNSRGKAFGEKQPWANFTHYQDVARNNVTVATGGLGFDLDLSCNGFTGDAIFSNKIGQYETIVENAYSLLPSLVIFYLMHRYPTAAHYVDKLEGAYEWAVGMANLSCGDVKKLAKKDPFSDGDEIAKAKCESDSGGDTVGCFENEDQDVAEVKIRYLDKFSENITNVINAIPGVTAGSDIQVNGTDTGIGPRTIDTSCYRDAVTLQDGKFNYTHAVFSLGMLDCKLWPTIGGLMPEFTQDRNSESAELQIDAVRDANTNPRKSVTTLAHEYRREFATLLEEIVHYAPEPGKYFTDLSSSEPNSTEQLRYDNFVERLDVLSKRVQTLIPTEHISALRGFKSKDNFRYKSAIIEMSMQLAELQLELEINHLKSSVNLGLALQSDSKMPEAVTSGLLRSLSSIDYGLRQVVLMKESSAQNLKEQRNILGL